MEVGILGEKKEVVTEEKAADHLGSGLLRVYATPAMVALMEATCLESVADEIGPDNDTVGIAIDVKHLAASPVGGEITCKSELVEIDRKRLVFHVEAFDRHEKIGEGTHQRFIINPKKFMEKAQAKLKDQD